MIETIKNIDDLKQYASKLDLMSTYLQESSLKSPTAKIALDKLKQDDLLNDIAQNLFHMKENDVKNNSIVTSIVYISHMFNYIIRMNVTKKLNQLSISFGSNEDGFLTAKFKIGGKYSYFVFDGFHRIRNAFVCDGDGFETSFNYCSSDTDYKKVKINRILPLCFGNL